MTTPIYAMPAGGEMDCLIAEKVMGWWLEAHMCNPPIPVAYMNPKDRAWYRKAEDWAPSTNIAHAWEVVERMIVLGKMFSMGSHGHDNEDWSAIFGSIGGYADTAPLAICRAALKAVS